MLCGSAIRRISNNCARVGVAVELAAGRREVGEVGKRASSSALMPARKRSMPFKWLLVFPVLASAGSVCAWVGGGIGALACGRACGVGVHATGGGLAGVAGWAC